MTVYDNFAENQSSVRWLAEIISVVEIPAFFCQLLHVFKNFFSRIELIFYDEQKPAQNLDAKRFWNEIANLLLGTEADS